MKPTKPVTVYTGNPSRLDRVEDELTRRNLSAESMATVAHCSLAEARVELRELVRLGRAERYETRVGSWQMFRLAGKAAAE